MNVACYRLNWISKSLISSVTDEHGRTMSDLAKLQEVELSKLKLGANLIKGATPSEDVLNSVGCELIVSDKFLSLLNGFRTPEWLRIGRVDVRTKSGRSYGYHIIDNKGARLDIADRTASKLTIASGVLIHAEQIVVRSNNLPSFDIFPIKPAAWAISDMFWRQLGSSKISGIATEYIKIIA